MGRQSQYAGKILDAGIARQLILELFAEQRVCKDEITKRVIDMFLKRSGEKTENMKQRVNEALGDLSSRYKLAKYLKECKLWEFSSPPETDKKSGGTRPYPKKIIGSGSGYIYIYSYPIYQSAAESKGETIWACKIGKTVNDSSFRVKEQTTGMPENPEIYLAIRTDKPELLEKIIHNILHFCGRKMPDSPGTEWFITSPSEIEDIYQKILETVN